MIRINNDTPRWFAVVVILVLLPVFQFPVLLANSPDVTAVRAMVWIYPIYVVVAAYLAWRSYAERPVLSWILLVLMVMSHVAMWLLVTTPII